MVLLVGLQAVFSNEHVYIILIVRVLLMVLEGDLLDLSILVAHL